MDADQSGVELLRSKPSQNMPDVDVKYFEPSASFICFPTYLHYLLILTQPKTPA